jgi:YidC/Oxa1 family membrane protein insertase
MNKRIILAIALSFLIMLTWSRLMQKHYPIEPQEVTNQTPQRTSRHIPSEQPPEQPQIENVVSAFTHDREFVFNLPSACIKKIIFSQFGDYEFNLEQGLCLADKNLVFTPEKLDSHEAIFVYQDATRKITKHFNYSDPNYVITLDIKIENLSEESLAYPSGLILGKISLASRGRDSWFQEIFIKQPDKLLRMRPGKKTNIQYSGEFFGFRDRYFCAILIPISFPETLRIVRSNNKESQLVLQTPTMEILSNQIGHMQYTAYVGPQQPALLKSFSNGTEEVVYYGFFDPISKLLLSILRLFYRLLHNWGWAVVVMSLVIFFALFPLTMKQLRSAKEMQHLQPKIEGLRRIYKDNPQRLNKEVLELYRKNKINPLGGCLPLIGQIPIFFSLYQALMRSIELKGANFLWIKDLSQPDRLVVSPEINILPILMAITMFVQQKFSMASAAGSVGEQQRIMSIFFPILFGIIFYRMPSGLVLYWFINSLLMVAFQSKIKLAHESIKH